jgi:ABC-2 type transport system ATP-binding protein
MAGALEIAGLVKQYSPQIRALDGIDLHVAEGEVFGLIGPNGAGKSTTIRIVATLLVPTEGSVKVLGRDVVKEQQEVRSIISYLPEEAGAYENLSGEEYLRFMARFYKGDAAEAVRRGIQIADLGDRIKSKTKEYSKGMKRRLLIGRTLMTDSRLYILDEPTGGLDVLHAHHIRNMIKERIRRTNTSALVSSHNLLEVEFLCDRVAIIHRGKIAVTGTPAELKARFSAGNLEDVFLEIVGHHHDGVKAPSMVQGNIAGATAPSAREAP